VNASAPFNPSQSVRGGILEGAIVALEPMINRLVFVGRHVTALLVANPVALKSRSTFCIDATVTAMSYSALDRLTADLSRLGLRPEGAPQVHTGRWITGAGLVVEVIPSDAPSPGIEHRWHEYALECTLAIPVGIRTVRIVGAPAFLALKLASFVEAEPDVAEPNADLEDALTVVNGRPGVEREIAAAPAEVSRFIVDQLGALASRPDADTVLENHIGDAARFPLLAVASLARLRRLAAL
jgi:hypothetical protein